MCVIQLSFLYLLLQMPAHIDPVNSDCEEVQSSCPWTQIGCPETKVWISQKFCFLQKGVSIKWACQQR